MPYTHFTPPEAFLWLHRLFSLFPFAERTIVSGQPLPSWYRLHRPTFTDDQLVQITRYLQPDTDTTCTIDYSRSRAVALAACYALFCSSMMPPGGRMGFAYTANLHGSGKSLLAKIPLYATAGTAHYESWKQDDDKMRATLDACAQTGVNHILFDNAPPYIQLASPSLEAFMTLPTWEGRKYNRNDDRFTVKVATTIFITANSLNLNADLGRRFLQCDLFVQEGNIQDREIAKDFYLDDERLATLAFRNDLLGALWTMTCAWDAAGRPLAEKGHRQGFRTWCELIGGLVEFTGFGDCLAMPASGSTTASKEEGDALALIEHLVTQAAEKQQTRIERSLDELIQTLHSLDLWEWLLRKGREETAWEGERKIVTFVPEHGCKVTVGQRLAKYCPHRDRQHPHHHRLYRLGPVLGTWTACTEGTGSYKKFILEKAS